MLLLDVVYGMLLLIVFDGMLLSDVFDEILLLGVFGGMLLLNVVYPHEIVNFQFTRSGFNNFYWLVCLPSCPHKNTHPSTAFHDFGAARIR